MKERILLVFDKGLGHGGVESVIMSIVRNLSDSFTFDLLTNTTHAKYYDEEFKSYGGNIYRIPYYEGRILFLRRLNYYIRGLYLYIRSLNFLKKHSSYKVIHCNNSTEGGIVLSAAKKVGIPIRVMHSHAVYTCGHRINALLADFYRNLITKSATQFIGCSENAYTLYTITTNCKSIYNSYDDQRFDKKLFQEQSSLDGIKLIQVGRFDKTKNQEFSLYVLKEIKLIFPDVTLDLIGKNNSEYYQFLKNLAEELDVLDNVNFHNPDSDIPKLLLQSNVFLFPSLSEGFGISLIEAQAMGIKCYASNSVPKVTNCGGVDFIPLSTGAKNWAKKIVEDFMSNKCAHKDYDCTLFSPKNIVTQYKKLYEGDMF